jgi:hypothetical protein
MDLWKTPGFPHRGWDCVDVIDLNPDNLPSECVDYESCEACGHYPVRFVHCLVHDEWVDEARVGCVCAERLTGDYVNPKRHEAELRRRSTARARWASRRWRHSARGNAWVKVRGHHVVVFPSLASEGWTFAVDGVVSRRTFPDERAACLASYDGYEYMSRPRRSLTRARGRPAPPG